MPYYVYRPDANNFAGVGFSIPDSVRVVQLHFTDRPVLADWATPVAHGFDDNPTTEGDFPSLSNFNEIPLMSQRAWETLRPLIGDWCEALPIVHPIGKPYFIIHCMATVDALDVAKSEVTRNATTGRVNRVFRYALKHDLVRGRHIFKLPRESGAELLVDDDFRRTAEGSGLKGLQFKEVPEVEAAYRV